MKLATAVIVTKGFCFVAMGFTTPLITGLAQWADTGMWPPAINWVVIIAACAGGAAAQLLSFLSQSYGTYTSGAGSKNSGQTPGSGGTSNP